MMSTSSLLSRSNTISSWLIVALATMLLLGLPIYTVIIGLLKGPGEYWGHLQQYLLPGYIANSILLVLGTGILTLVWGLPAAWLVSTTEFPGRKLLEWLLIMPLSIPTYIMAFTYAGIFDYTGFVQTTLRDLFGFRVLHIDILNIYGAMLVMSLALFPYVYIIARTAFLSRFRALIEASQTLGASVTKSFFKVILPISRPALVAGLSLVAMEVLNDYGAVTYYGVTTFTTGIFRSWFSLEDIQAAIYLSAMLLITVFFILLLEKYFRGNERFYNPVLVDRPLQKRKLAGLRKWAAIVACFLPVLLGFVIPVIQLINWGISAYKDALHIDFLPTLANSFKLGIGASLFCVGVSLLLLFVSRMQRSRVYDSIMKLSTMGYAIPGAVVAIGVLVPFLFLDKQLLALFKGFDVQPVGLILTGTIAGLLFAFTVRYLSVAFNPVESGYEKVAKSMDEAAATLGAGNWKRLLSIDFRLLRGALGTALLLVFVDVLKELPLTLILRPFNFNTLATRAFELASDEQIAAAAVPSLVIILAGAVPVYILNVIITKNK